MSPEVQEAFDALHAFMFSTVYRNPVAKEEEKKVPDLVRKLYRYYAAYPEKLPEEMRRIAEQEGLDRAVCDYIAGMSDRFAVQIFEKMVVPKSWGL